jgi:hypothetical protein
MKRDREREKGKEKGKPKNFHLISSFFLEIFSLKSIFRQFLLFFCGFGPEEIKKRKKFGMVWRQCGFGFAE